jgi:hypothetical protein
MLVSAYIMQLYKFYIGLIPLYSDGMKIEPNLEDVMRTERTEFLIILMASSSVLE